MVFRETTSTEHTISVLSHFFRVESSTKGTGRSVSETDGVTELGPDKPFSPFIFEGPRRACDPSRVVLYLVACLIFFSELPQQNFCKSNSWFSLLLHHEYLPAGSGLAQRWYEYLMLGDSAEVNGEKWTELNDGWSLVFTKAGWFTGAASVFSEARGKSCDLKIFLSQGKMPAARKPLASISPVAARLYAVPHCSPIW